MTETLRIVCAIVVHRGKYFLARRAAHKSNPGMWEFPGGKIHEGETPDQAIVRELKEEFDITADVQGLVGRVTAILPEGPAELIAISVVIDQVPKSMTDHDEFRWVEYKELSSLVMTPLDYELLDLLKQHGDKDLEILKVDAKSMALIYGAMYGLVGIVMAVFILVFPARMGMVEASLGHVSAILMAAFMPFVNFAVGAVFGYFIALIYNSIASAVGGVKLRWR